MYSEKDYNQNINSKKNIQFYSFKKFSLLIFLNFIFNQGYKYTKNILKKKPKINNNSSILNK